MLHNLQKSKSYRFHKIIWKTIDWIYPPRCAGCSTAGVRFCSDCFVSINTINQQKVCPQCGIPQSSPGPCPECRNYPPVYNALRSWGLYEGALREAIHHLKYRSNLGISEDLAEPLSRLLNELNWQVELITPVPLSRKRMRSRGYNQSSLIARWVAMASGIPFKPSALERSKDTVSQVGLSGEERRRNVTGAFEPNRQIIAGKSILVIDDVTTTGATMQACALALTEGGAKQIYGLTLARAGHIDLS